MLDLSAVNKNWTLFLDRDGVINVDKSPYTLNADEFEFYDGVPDAINTLGSIFKYIIVVTNQRGVGRNLMSENDLTGIHQKMTKAIIGAGGRVDSIYYCTAIEDSNPDRKPNPGMAFKAMKKYPDIIASQSIMVGNNISDMKFGRSAGLHTVLLTTTGIRVNLPDRLVDLQFDSLPEFTDNLIDKLRS